MLKKGDKVIMHSCLESRLPKYQGKVWICASDEFRAEGGIPVVFLDEFRGYFAAEFLKKVESGTA